MRAASNCGTHHLRSWNFAERKWWTNRCAEPCIVALIGSCCGMDKELHPAAPEPPPPIPPAPDQGPAPIDEQAAASQSAARQHGAPAPSAKRKERVHWSNVERGEDFNLTVNFPDSATSKTVDVSMFRDQVSGLSRSRIPSWAYGAKTEGADSWHNAITSIKQCYQTTLAKRHTTSDSRGKPCP